MICQWTSKALSLALTPNNIRAGFRRTGIWPLDIAATEGDMGPAAMFRESANAAEPAYNEATGAYQGESSDGDQDDGDD